MNDNSHLISGVAERYASSLFELALELDQVDAVSTDLDRFEALIHDSDDLKRLISSPVFSGEDQMRTIGAIARKANMSELVANFLQVVARNRRLFALPSIIRGYRALAARHRGEMVAEVTSAHALSEAQETDLIGTLSGLVGQKVTMKITVDPSILGGLIVRLGSRQIDTSLKTKLSSLKLTLKEVG